MKRARGRRGRSPFRIPPGRAEERYSIAVETRHELDGINKILRAPGEWLHLAHLKTTEDPQKALSALLKRKEELEKRLAQSAVPRRKPSKSLSLSSSQVPLARRHALETAMMAMMSAQQYAYVPGASAQSGYIPAFGDPLTYIQRVLLEPKCPILMLGQVQASHFREYQWSIPDGGTGEIAFWPLSGPPQFPNSTIFTGWVGDTGGHFLGALSIPGNPMPWPFIDPSRHMASAGVLQFTLPALPCDAYLCWGTRAIADGTGWFIDASDGELTTNWLVHEGPDGSGFPMSVADGFRSFVHGLSMSTYAPETKRSYTELNLGGCFDVKKGVSAKVHLGCSLSMFVRNGEVRTWTVGDVDDRFEFRYGVTYLAVGAA